MSRSGNTEIVKERSQNKLASRPKTKRIPLAIGSTGNFVDEERRKFPYRQTVIPDRSGNFITRRTSVTSTGK